MASYPPSPRSYPPRPVTRRPGGLASALEAILGAIGQSAMSKDDPFWRLKLGEKARAEREAEMRMKTEQLQQRTQRAGLLDKLSGTVGSAMEGFPDSVPPQEQTTIGADESTGNRGYAVNLPSPGAVPPDFLPPELASTYGFEMSPGLRNVVLNAARGKAAQSKRALEYTRAATRAQEQANSQAWRSGENRQRERFLTAQEERRIEERRRQLDVLEGGRNARFAEGQSRTDARAQRAGARSTLSAVDRADAAAFREYDRAVAIASTPDELRRARAELSDRLTSNADRLGDPFDTGQEPDSGPPPTAPVRPPSIPRPPAGAPASGLRSVRVGGVDVPADQVPPEILAIIQRAQRGEALSPGDVARLQTWKAQRR